jgi:aspartate aminotransferase-like enzyme
MSESLTTVRNAYGDRPASGHLAEAFRDRIKAQGILTAAGLGRYEATGFRIGHMGDIRMADIERTLAAVSEALHDSLVEQ